MFTWRLMAGRAGDILAAAEDLPRIGQFEPGDDPEKRRLAASRRPQQRKKFPRGNVQGHVVKGFDIAEIFTDMLYGEALVGNGILILIHILKDPGAISH